MLGYTEAEVAGKAHAGGFFRSAAGRRAGKGPEPRVRDRRRSWLPGTGFQGRARHRGPIRADLDPQGRQPASGSRIRHCAGRSQGRSHRLSSCSRPTIPRRKPSA
jgi:hypothetical protein